MPPNTVKVDRSTPWGNPFITSKHGTQEECALKDGAGLYQLNGENFEPADYEIDVLDYCMEIQTLLDE